MSRVVELLCSRRTPQVAVLALMSFGFAGCSADMRPGISQNSSPIHFIAARHHRFGRRADAQVERGELPQDARPQAKYQTSALPPPISAPSPTAPAPASPAEGGGSRPIRRRPAPIETTGSVAPRSIAATQHRRAKPASPSSSAPATPWRPWRTAIA